MPSGLQEPLPATPTQRAWGLCSRGWLSASRVLFYIPSPPRGPAGSHPTARGSTHTHTQRDMNQEEPVAEFKPGTGGFFSSPPTPFMVSGSGSFLLSQNGKGLRSHWLHCAQTFLFCRIKHRALLSHLQAGSRDQDGAGSVLQGTVTPAPGRDPGTSALG